MLHKFYHPYYIAHNSNKIKSAIYAFLLNLFFCLLLIFSTAHAQDTPQAQIEADELSFDEQNGIAYARGNIHINYAGKTLRADAISWEQNNDKLIAQGHVELTQADGTRIMAETITLENQFRDGIVSALYISLPHDTQNAWLKGKSARLSDNTRYELNDAIYSACTETCPGAGKSPLWQMRARKIIYDKPENFIYYHHPWLEFWEIPVLYIPYFAHPAPSETRKTGLLFPRFQAKEKFGFTYEQPVYINLAPNYDMRITPHFTSNEGVFLNTTWRHLTTFGRYDFDLYYHRPEDELATIDGDYATRRGITGKGKFRFGNWESVFHIETPSDDLFFSRYDINEDTVLQNRFILRRPYENGQVTAKTIRYRYILNNKTDATVDRLMPQIENKYRFRDKFANGTLTMLNRIDHSRHASGIDITHALTQFDWVWRKIDGYGFEWKIQNRSTIDGFAYDNGAQTVENTDDEEDSLLASTTTGFMASYPLINAAANKTQLLTPHIQLIISSNNEAYDDVLYSKNAINLSENSLFRLNAPIDEASRINYGIDYQLEYMNGFKSLFFIGQSYNASSREFASTTGYGEDFSNIISKMQFDYHQHSYSQSIHFDKNGRDIHQNDTALTLKNKFGALKIQYLFLSEAETTDDLPDRELKYETHINLSRHWQLRASRYDDLETNTPLRKTARLAFENCCTLIEVSYDRDYSEIDTIEPTTSYGFFIHLKTLGELGSR